jgi:cell division protein FtsB
LSGARGGGENVPGTSRGPARADSVRPVMFGVVLLFVTLLCAAGLKSYRDLTAARARERQLETRIEGTRGTIDRLRTRIDRLRGDAAMLERLAREDLGLVRRQDVVIELPPPQLVAPPPALPSPQAQAPPPSLPPPGP